MLSSKYLTHKHASFNGCTFFEAAVLFAVVLVSIGLIQVALTIMVGYGFIWLFLFLLCFPLFKSLSAKVGKLKEYKPYGYIAQGMRVRLSNLGLMKSPYFTATGRLIARRRR